MMTSTEPCDRDTIKSIIFTVDELEARRRLDAWNAAFGSLNEITLPLDEKNVLPSVRSENWLLGGGLVLSQTNIKGARFQRDSKRLRRDSLDHWVLRVIRRGCGRLHHAAFEAVTKPGDLVFFSIDETWSVDWEDVEWVSVTIPRDFDLRLSMGLATLPHGILQGAGAALLADVMLNLPARVAAAEPQEVPGITAVLQAAVSACLLSASCRGSSDVVPLQSENLAKYRVQRAIMKNIGSARLSPATLAVQAGMSRSALYRLFEKEGGVARYIRNMRLSLARTALSDPALAGQSIAVIAEEHGFHDPPEFSRAFRAYHGVSPREVRSSLKNGAHDIGAGPQRKVSQGQGDLIPHIYARV
jgi:AraC-like DNA-binding protein